MPPYIDDGDVTIISLRSITSAEKELTRDFSQDSIVLR